MSNATWKRAAGGAGLLAAGLVAGGILAGTLSANAADTGTTTTAPQGPTGSSSGAPVDPSQPQPQRSDETLLTGDTKASVEKAVLATYPGATIERTETDSDGVYESHIVTTDGRHVIVQVGKDFAVTGTQTGGPGGAPGGGQHGPAGGQSGTPSSGGA
jgi:hypothetical protein